MDYLKDGIGLRAMAQRDPLIEYQREGYEMFQTMMGQIKEESVGFLYNLEVEVRQSGEEVEARACRSPSVENQKLQYTAANDAGEVEVRNDRGQVQQAATSKLRQQGAPAAPAAPAAEARGRSGSARMPRHPRLRRTIAPSVGPPARKKSPVGAVRATGRRLASSGRRYPDPMSPRILDQSSKLKDVLYEIRGAALVEADRLEADGHRILKLNTGNPAVFGFEAPYQIVRDMIEAVPHAHGYSDSRGIMSARRAVVSRYEQVPGFPAFDPDDVYLGNGCPGSSP
jgi:hypothetical protein